MSPAWHGGSSLDCSRFGILGTGKDPAWKLAVADLGDALVYREDPLMPGVHGFVEPALATTLDEYESALLMTRRAWRLP